MKKLTVNKVKQYFAWRTDEELSHCPEAIAAACNDMSDEYAGTEFGIEAAEAKDYMKLLFFNDPIKGMFTHSYGFHTATGRMLIEKLKQRYYEHNEN